MRKIRGFKLNLRLKELQRRAKKAKIDLVALQLGAEPALQAWIDPIVAASRPAVLYDSFPAESAAGLAPMPGLAFSLALATLGPDMDAYTERLATERPETLPLLDVACAVALDEAVRFVLSLLEEEAAGERCTLSPHQFLDGREALEAALAKLEGHKIGVALSESGLRPARSTAFSVSWLAKARSRAKA